MKLIESFGYVICLNVSKFIEFLNKRSISDNEKTPSLRLKPQTLLKLNYKTLKMVPKANKQNIK